MDALERAIKSEDWEVAAHILAIAVLRVAEIIPPETLSAMLDLLAEGGDAREG